jgi:Dolichyl-phosphate-mannose-protein mannosyltransferase
MDPMSITRRGATGLSLLRRRGISWPGARRGPAASDPVGTARPHASAASEFAIIAALCLWTLIHRLSFFFPDTIDWDESTLILMGQGILDGYLPYDRIWDSKPPLAFVAFAGAIELLGRTVAALRFVGYLCVVLTSYLVYRTSWLIAQDKLSACVAALVSAAMMSVLEPALMTELLCAPLLAAALLVLCSWHGSLPRAFLVGLMIGIAVMIRTNLAVLALALGGYVSSRPPLVPLARPVTRGFAYAAGVLLIVSITVIPYLVSGRLPLWFDTVVRAGIEFSSNRRSFENLLKLVQNGFGIRSDGSTRYQVLLLGALLWMGGLAGLLCCAGGWRQLSQQRRHAIVAAAVFLVGAMLSVAVTGPPYGHYLVQIVPWFAIFLGFAIASARTRTARWFLATGISAALIAAAVVDTRASYALLLKRIEQGKSLAYGPAYEIAEYVRTAGAGKSSLYMMSDQLVYWLVGAYPPTRVATHPSVLTKPDIIAVIEGPNATPETELRKILEARPEFVVKPQSVDYLSGWPEVAGMLEEALARNYVLETVIAGRQIYRRKPDAT